MLTSCKLLFDFDLFYYSDLLLSRFASTLFKIFSSLMGSIDEPSMFKFLVNVEILLLLSRITCLLFLISSGLDSAGGSSSFAAYTINGTSDGFDSLITSCFYPSLLTFDLFSLFFASICPSFLFEASFSMFF